MGNAVSIVQAHLPLGQGPWKTFDPFLFCVHHCDDYPEGDDEMGPKASLKGRTIGSDFSARNGWSMYHGQKVPGFPQHPHRGFETISIIRKGLLDHSDSLGATARIGAGDVQWMTAGAGIVHAEMFPLVHRNQKNPTDFFQLWLNLPAAKKMVSPQFKMFWSEEVPKWVHHDKEGRESIVTVVAGTINGITPPSPPIDSWAAMTQSDVAIWMIDLSAEAKLTLPTQPKGTKRVIYHVDGGQVDLGGTRLEPQHGALMQEGHAHPISAGQSASVLLVLQARPIGEPIVQHGPFVMNHPTEIRQAIYDYQRTGFGGWPWRGSAPTHDRDKGRFARFADGQEIVPNSIKKE